MLGEEAVPLTAAGILEKMLRAGGGAVGSNNGEGLQRGGQGFAKGTGEEEEEPLKGGSQP